MKKIIIICILSMMLFGANAAAFRLYPKIQGMGCPMDVQLTDGEEVMYVVCDRGSQKDDGLVLRFEWIDEEWEFRGKVFSGQDSLV